jgi:hypothetical protein
MGKNSGFNETNRQVSSAIDRSHDQSQEMEGWLRQLFNPAYNQGVKYTEDAYGKLNDTYNRYGNMYGNYGGVASSGLGDEYDQSRDFYRNLIKTGGFDENQKGLYRRNALAPTQGFWDSYKEEMRRANAINPFNVGAGAQSASSARKAAQDINQTGINAETNLNQMIREGQLAGAAGDERIAGNINQNKLSGMSGQMGALAGETNVANSISGLGERMLNMSHALIDKMLASRTLDANSRNQLLQLKAQMNPKVSSWDRIMKIGSIIANGAMTAISMGGNQAGKSLGGIRI